MATDFTIKQFDQLPEIQTVLKDDLGNAVNLTGIAGVRFVMKNKSTNEVKIDAPASVVNAAAGLVKYSWEQTDTDTPAVYNGEFEVEMTPGGKLESFPNYRHIQIKVFADLGGVR